MLCNARALGPGGTGRWVSTVANTTGVGAATIVTGADGTGTAVYEGVADPLRLAVADALSAVELGVGAWVG